MGCVGAEKRAPFAIWGRLNRGHTDRHASSQAYAKVASRGGATPPPDPPPALKNRVALRETLALIECHTRSATAAQCVGSVLIGAVFCC